jgi:hypothetical protein
VPEGSVAGVNVIVGGAMVNVYCWLALALVLSVAVTVMLNVPPAVGVPDNTPVDLFSVIPAGNVPDSV